jgi:hypothetical protein
MKKFLVVLFILLNISLNAQIDRPDNMAFSGIADFIRYFDFIASDTSLPSIQQKGIQFINWADSNYPELFISNGIDWVKFDKNYLTGGATTYPSYTNNLDGTITVDACCINLYDNPNFQGNPKPYEFSISTFTVSMNETNYIIANYNSGSPELQNITDVSLITESDIVPILTVYAVSNEHIHTLNWDSLGLGLSNKLHQRLVKTNRFALETGLDVTQTTGLQFDISTGTVWYGATKTELDIFHSNNGNLNIVYPTGTVATSTWQFTYSWASYDVEAFSTATSTQKLLSSSGVADIHKLHSITTLIGTNKSESSVIICSLRRLGADANDTYTSDIYLISADFHIPIEKLGELDGHF